MQEIFDVSFADERIKATSVTHLDTGAQAVMNSATYSDGRHHLLAIGMDNECHLYSLKYKVVQTEDKKSGETTSLFLYKGKFRQTIHYHLYNSISGLFRVQVSFAMKT